MNHLNKKVALLIAILFSLCCIQLASAAIYYTPAYANVSENFMLNITVSAPETTGNVTQVIVQDMALPPFAVDYTSNSSSITTPGVLLFTPAGLKMAWYNLTEPGIITNGTNQSFTIWMNNTMAGAPSSFKIVVCLYNSTVQAPFTRDCNSQDPFFVGNQTITIGMNFGFSGYVKNDTGILQNGTNITVYEYIMGTSGPPTEIPIASAITGGTGTTGLFRFHGLNGSASLYKIKLLYNNSIRATLVGPNLPPFPSNMFYSVPPPPGAENMPMFKKMPNINGSTFYLQPAVTINVSAVGNVPPGNGSGKSVKFGYELIDNAVGFPIESNVRSNNWNKKIVVPMGRSYTVMLLRDPISFTGYDWCFEGDTPLMNATACPSPPTSMQVTSANLSNEAGGQGGILNITINLSYSMQYLSGCLDLSGNSTLVNITKVITRLTPWTGFVPPMDAKISDFNVTNSSDNLVYNDARCAGFGTWGTFYNVSLMGSANDIGYLMEFYAKNSSDEATNGTVALAGFQNLSMGEASKWLNITLYPLTGQYVTSSTANTTKMKIMVQNSSGAAITTSMHMQVKVKHPVFGTMNYIIEDLSGGITYLPILNNSNWAKVSVYPNEGPPVEKTLNLALTQNNVTVQIGEMTFRRPLPNGSLDSQGINVSNKDIDPFTGINMTFYRNADGCNTPNPPESCVLTRMDANDFNPMVVMMAGKVNLELKMTGSGTTLFFVNFDLLSAKPPTNSIMSNNASSASASAQTQTWEAGSFVPHVYDHAFVVMPYNESRGAPDYINESLSSFNMSLPYLKDENWNIVWNGTNGSTTASLPDEYTDFNAGIYAPLLRTGGSNCSLTNASSACFMNKTNSSTIGGYFSLRVPHFSGVGAGITGLAPAAGAAATTTTTTTSGASSGSTAETEVSESRTFTNIAANSENTFRISNAEKIGVNALVFSTTEDLANVRVTVTKLVARPSSVDKAPEGGLYRYIEVDAPMLEGKLKEAKVQFEVTKKWLDDNDYKPEHIRLVRFADNSWRTLTTSILSEQSDKVFYEAITPGFSYFAITAVKEAEEADAEEAEEAEDTSVGEDALITAPTAEEKESSLIRTLLIVVGVLALLLLAALGYKKKRVLVFWREPTDKERQEHLRGQFLKRKKQQSWGGGND